MLLCIVYLPPERSSFYNFSQFEGIQLLEDHLINLDINIDLHDILIMGELNARTGVENDFVSTNKLVLELEEYRDILNDDCAIRASRYKIVNKFGSDLLAFCKMYSGNILNGRSGNDKGVGDFTSIGSTGSSVIDYAICSD